MKKLSVFGKVINIVLSYIAGFIPISRRDLEARRDFKARGYFFLYCFFIMLFLVSACETPIDKTLDPGDNNKLVVEGIITDENTVQKIRLSQSYSDPNQTPVQVSDAKVFIFFDNNFYEFIHDDNELGVYKSQADFAASENLEYQLRIEWNSQEYLSSAKMGEVNPINDFPFRQLAGKDSFEIDGPSILYQPDERAYYEVDLDWRHLIPGDSSQARLYFYSFSTIDPGTLIRAEKEKIIFPKGTIARIKKYGLTDAFTDYLRALAKETEWNGGILDEISSSLPTNISNEGIGFFAVCELDVKSLEIR